jgi:cytochrome P450
MMTFADLRKQMTPPTAEQVAATVVAEINALADEFATSSTPMFGVKRAAAERLTIDVAIAIHGKDSALGKLLVAFRRGDIAAFPVSMDEDEIHGAADAFETLAADIAADWRSALEYSA